MREIKFRAWDKAKNKMTICFCINGRGELKDLRGKHLHGNKKMFVMQYTGLKDKNSKEIYEGDIVKAFLDKKRGYAITKVWYMSPAWKLADYTSGKLSGSFDMVDWGYGEEVDEFEVIGNIYENKDII